MFKRNFITRFFSALINDKDHAAINATDFNAVKFNKVAQVVQTEEYEHYTVKLAKGLNADDFSLMKGGLLVDLESVGQRYPESRIEIIHAGAYPSEAAIPQIYDEDEESHPNHQLFYAVTDDEEPDALYIIKAVNVASDAGPYIDNRFSVIKYNNLDAQNKTRLLHLQLAKTFSDTVMVSDSIQAMTDFIDLLSPAINPSLLISNIVNTEHNKGLIKILAAAAMLKEHPMPALDGEVASLSWSLNTGKGESTLKVNFVSGEEVLMPFQGGAFLSHHHSGRIKWDSVLFHINDHFKNTGNLTGHYRNQAALKPSIESSVGSL